jgi:hypothetical protein
MGSLISLRIGKLEVDWGKNAIFTNHSSLFRKDDLKAADYFYADGVTERKPAYVRNLRHVVPRLDLLGFSLKECRREYEQAIKNIPSHYATVTIGFDVFCKALQTVDVDQINIDRLDGDFDLGELGKHLLNDPAFQNSIPTTLTDDDGTFFENLSPYLILRLLAENPKNLDRDLVWGLDDVIEGGWVDGEIFEPLDQASRYLIVTEGSSDSSILKAALPLVAPDVDDFFDFVDMKDNYPFTGTGNLVNFCKGLVAVRAQNKIVVVLDNDTAGLAALKKLEKLNIPRNIRLVSLPNLEAFRAFPTLGPSGRSIENVNGRALAIECFLDLEFGPREERAIRWTGYDKEVGTYQGELIAKEIYTKLFLEEGASEHYDRSKLRFLWQHILRACAE